MAESQLRVQSKAFAKKIIWLCRKLRKQRVEKELTGQLLRAGTSIGANIYEAQFAQSDNDFVSKYEIALKECNESAYWLELIYEVDSMSAEDFEEHHSECISIRKMLVSSVKTLKEKRNK